VNKYADSWLPAEPITTQASFGMMMMFLWTDTTMRLLQWEEASASLSKLVGKSISVLDDGTIPQVLLVK
jgi:hypothetical protein